MRDEAPALLESLESKASLFAHLGELQSRLRWVAAFFFAASFLSFFFSRPLLRALIWPYQRALGSQGHAHLIYTAPQEYFFVQLKLACLAGFVATLPLIAFHIYRFVAPGLFVRERKMLLPFLVGGPVLFLLGALTVYFLVMPTCLRFFWLMSQSSAPQIELLPRVSDYLGLVLSFIVAFGLCFQLPLIVLLLHAGRFVTLEGLRRGRRYAIVACFALAAVLTPPDVLSQVMLGGPMVLIYEISILAVAFVEKRAASNVR